MHLTPWQQVIQRNLLSIWLMKALGAAIIVMHRITFSWFCLKLIFAWRGITFVSLVLSWERMFVLAVSEQKGWGWLFHTQLKGSNTFSFEIQWECTEIFFLNWTHWNLKSVILISYWCLLAVFLKCQNVLRTLICDLNCHSWEMKSIIF